MRARALARLVAIGLLSGGFALGTPIAHTPVQDATTIDRLEATARTEAATQTAQGRRAAVVLWLDAAASWSRAANPAREATALVQAAILQNILGDRAIAIQTYERVLGIRRTLNDPAGVAQALNGIASLVRQGGDVARALVVYAEAIELVRQAGDRALESSILHNLGGLEFERNQLTVAHERYTAALAIRRDIDDLRGAGESLIGLALVRRNQGFTGEAVTLATEALQLKTQAGDLDGEAAALQNLGVSFERLGAFDDALACYEQSLAISRRTGNRRGESGALRGAAFVSRQLEDLTRALGYAQAAVELSRAAGDLSPLGDGLIQLGILLERSGRVAEARADYVEALDVMRRIGNRQGEANVIRVLAHLAMRAGDFDAATRQLADGLAVARAIGHTLEEARALEGLGALEIRRGRPAAAVPYLTDALARNATLRAAVAVPDRRATLQLVEDDTHRLLVQAHLMLDDTAPGTGHVDRAFELSERARARSLRELVIETRTELSAAVPADLALQHRQLRDQLAVRTQLLLRLEPAAPTREAALTEVTALERRIEALDADIRARDPRYAALINPALRPVEELRQLLPEGTIALHYLIGSDASYVFVVDRTRVTVRRLGPGAAIDAAARELASRLKQGSGREAQTATAIAASALAGRILVPIADRLARNRLVIVPDGSLQYVPFAMLPVPKTARRLVDDHEIVMLTSLSSLVDLRALAAGRPPAARPALILGDPVLRPDDARVGPTAGRPAPSTAAPDTLARAMRGGGLDTLARLPHTRREATAIAALAGRGATLALDFDASRDRVLAPDLPEYRVIHLATHGLIDSRNPTLSGLVLSLVDATGQPRSGFVALRDVYALRLAADLVVLSACRTALGADVRGEGLLGLTRGFMHAGAPRVVASLWDVQDDSTAAFMQAFYRALFQDQVPAATALRRAQLALQRQPRFAAPYYWAGFVLHGDWK